jgi:hypothetical protein
MLMFLAIAYLLDGDKEASSASLKEARSCVDSEYWRDRFAAFHLDELLTNFPTASETVHTALAELRARLMKEVGEWVSLERGTYPSANLKNNRLAERSSTSV